MVRHRRITCVLPAPAAGNCVRTASKKLSVKNFLSHDYWPMLSAYSGSNRVWADRQRAADSGTVFIADYLHRNQGLYSQKNQASSTHCSHWGHLPICCRTLLPQRLFPFRFQKPGGWYQCISYILCLYIISSKGISSRYETSKWKLEGRLNWNDKYLGAWGYDHAAGWVKKLYSFRDGKNKQKNRYTLPLCCTYPD